MADVFRDAVFYVIFGDGVGMGVDLCCLVGVSGEVAASCFGIPVDDMGIKKLVGGSPGDHGLSGGMLEEEDTMMHEGTGRLLCSAAGFLRPQGEGGELAQRKDAEEEMNFHENAFPYDSGWAKTSQR